MGLLDIFDSGDKKKRLSHIRNLCFLAAADGELDDKELALILKIGARVGLSHDELNRIIKRPGSISFAAPDNFIDRLAQLYDMVLVMMIDSEIHENEVALCKLTAIRLGFKHQVIDSIVARVIEAIAEGIALEIVLSELEREYE